MSEITKLQKRALKELGRHKHLLDTANTVERIIAIYDRFCNYTWAYESIDIIDFEELCELQQDFAGLCYKRADKLGIGEQYRNYIRSL